MTAKRVAAVVRRTPKGPTLPPPRVPGIGPFDLLRIAAAAYVSEATARRWCLGLKVYPGTDHHLLMACMRYGIDVSKC
jgi:hypothetical protein